MVQFGLVCCTVYFFLHKFVTHNPYPSELVTQVSIQTTTTTEKPRLNSTNKQRALIFTIAVGDQWFKPLVKANRENYCKRHGYLNLFLENLTVPLEPGLHINWSKITEGLRLFNESAPYDWIFFADLDLFIMNMNQTIENVIGEAIQNRYLREQQLFNASLESIKNKTDMILAKDLNGLNFGSIMVRNSPYARHMFEEIWRNRYNKQVPKLKMWHENAVFVHLWKTLSEYASHVTETTQNAMNAYSGRGNYKYSYKPGDFVIHFPGPFKTEIPYYAKKLTEIQPELKPIYEAYQMYNQEELTHTQHLFSNRTKRIIFRNVKQRLN
jgi:hypothetical protein